MRIELGKIPGLKVTIMGLGLNGGGLPSARFFAERGARVTVTDTKTEEQLKPSIEALADLSVKYVLGEHRLEDFSSADLVVKNPAVSENSPYLQVSKQVETDISLFCSLVRPPILAVTGTKGKSTTASAIHHIIKSEHPEAKLGGNITMSPLSFLSEIEKSEAPVVLELSSWQLSDLRHRRVMHPEISLVTNILNDHQDRYANFEEYIEDKREIFRCQNANQVTLLNYDDKTTRSFSEETPGKPRYFSALGLPRKFLGSWLEQDRAKWHERGEITTLFEGELSIPGLHNRLNILAACTAAALFGTSLELIRREALSFPGVPHRLELVSSKGGIRFYNDSTATIPEATLAAVSSFDEPIHLIAGGTDKNLDFSPFKIIGERVDAAYLLEGSATEMISSALQDRCRQVFGPFNSLQRAFETAIEGAKPGQIVLLSPGCASFGMFANEFDRGRRFKALVEELPR